MRKCYVTMKIEPYGNWILARNFLEKIVWNLFLGLFVALDQMHHLRPFAAPGQKNKLVESSQNYLAIFTENSKYGAAKIPDFECL